MPTKQRTFSMGGGGGIYRQTYRGDLVAEIDYSKDKIVGRQITTSINNPWPPKGLLKKMNIGGGFVTQKTEMDSYSGAIRFTAGDPKGIFYEYSGPFYAYSYAGNFTAVIPPSSDAELNAAGTTAIASAVPTNPGFSALTSIGELMKDGIPPIPRIQKWKDRTDIARKSGSDYLTYQFGWAPLVRDIISFCKTVRDTDKIVNQFYRDSGKVVRRRRQLPTVRDTVITPMGASYGSPALHRRFFNNPGQLSKEVKTTRERWFSGAFTYLAIPGNTPGGKVARAVQTLDRLYGIRPTPAVIWNLAPWSWAIDWVTNAGDVIKNISAFSKDGLVMKYGYIMERITIETTYTLRDLELNTGAKITLSQSFRQIVKTRRSATPFGFGVNPGSFSPRQNAILIALGMSRS